MAHAASRIPQTEGQMPHLPLDGGGVCARKRADGGGDREKFGESPLEAKPPAFRASLPQSALRADSFPIEGEQERGTWR